MVTSRPRAFWRSQRQLRVGGGPAELLLVDAMDRAVVDDLAVLVAPGRVEDLPDLELRRVAGDHAVDEADRVRAGDAVLVQRADVDERGRLADRVVLDVVGVGVDARGVVARPLPPLHLPVQGRRPGVEGGADAHVLADLLLCRGQYADSSSADGGRPRADDAVLRRSGTCPRGRPAPRVVARPRTQTPATSRSAEPEPWRPPGLAARPSTRRYRHRGRLATGEQPVVRGHERVPMDRSSLRPRAVVDEAADDDPADRASRPADVDDDPSRRAWHECPCDAAITCPWAAAAHHGRIGDAAERQVGASPPAPRCPGPVTARGITLSGSSGGERQPAFA